ncbi:hypothetical protein PC122_g11814 [Phytophthora cactorum]|nr:hypothetical protein PC122_g11814 [Phytophthora cactorum]
MGVSQSKGGDDGGVRWKLRPLVPRSWADLEQLHVRFQQEVHRRRAEPAFQYFLPFSVFQAIVTPLCPDMDKLQLLAMFEALDLKSKRKLAVMDFFSGLALLVDAKKPQKLEFVLSLLDNGGVKTLNKCELTMVVSAASRGLKMFAPGADVLQEATMRPLIRRLFGASNEVLRQTVVNKALADPEILFFMSDLEAGVATSSGQLLIQQGKLMKHMAYLDFQAARVTTSEERGTTAAVADPGCGPSKATDGKRAPTALPTSTAESFARRLQSVVCPPPPKGPDQSMRVLPAVEVKKYVDAHTLQRLIKVVSDGGLSLSQTEATALVGDMTVDQFGLVRCGDILRVMTAWQNRRREKPEALWEIVSIFVIESVTSMEKRMNAALASFGKRTVKTLGPTARRRTAVAKDRLLESLQNVNLKPDVDDGELQWSFTIHVGENAIPVQAPPSSPTLKRVGASLGNNIRFRLGIHPPNSDVGVKTNGTKLGKEGQLDYDSDDSQPEDPDIDTMRLIVNFLLNPEITDEEGIDLASSVEKAIEQDLVWSSFESLWTKCSVTVQSAIRSEGGVQPVIGKCLRICIDFREDFISDVEECTGISLAAGIRSFFVVGELDQSLSDILHLSQEMATLLQSLGKRQNRERAMRMIFDAFDADHNGGWSLQEFNAFQQALGKEAILEATLAELFGGASTIPFDKFMATYERYPAARLFEMIRRLGIGSLGDLVKGSVSITSTLNEPCVKALGVLLSPLRWADAGWKKLLVFTRSTKDLSLEVRFTKLGELVQKYFSHDTADFVTDPLFVALWIERLKEFVQPPHAEHSKDRPCRSMFCSLEHEVIKTEQQLEFDDQIKRLPRGTSARRAEAMIPFLEMAKLVKAHVRGPEVLEICSKSIRIVFELDNFWVAPSTNTNPATKDDAGLTFSSEESKAAYTQALQDRHCGLYQDAVNALEAIIEHEADSEKLWVELAITQFQLWEAHVRALHLPSILEISSTTQSKRPGGLSANAKPLHTVLLQEVYSTFLIAMEYPNSKSSPEFLLPLVRLYIEFGSYQGALAVCTLLVEGYPTSPRLNEAIFLSALTASAMDRHRESAQYFQYLAEGQPTFPYRLAAYQFSLLAALELSHVPGMRALERETYTQAYKALVALPPVLPSEKTAHTLFTTSRKNEEQRTLLWCRDVQTWMDLAQRLAGPANAPLLVISALREARRRMKPASGGLPGAKLLLEGASLLRTGDDPGAEKVFAEALLQLPRDEYYIARHERFLLEICSASWRARFASEHRSAARLQTFLRRCWRLAKWHLGVAYVLEQRRHAMALRIQCAWRGLKARQKLDFLREKQREKEELANIAMGAQDDRLIELRLNAAARKIQSLLQIARDKRTVRALRARKIEREALLARFAGRRTELGQLGVFRRWRSFVFVQKQERLDAVVLIQQQFRAWYSRKLCNQMLLLHRQQNSILQQCLARRSASLISRVFQAWHTDLVEARGQRDWASRLIQRRYRSRLAVRQYHIELRRHRAATATMNRLLSDRRRQMLLSSWRALANHAFVRHLRKRGAAVTIQKHMRGVLARKEAKRLRARRRRALNVLVMLTRSRESQLLQTGFDLLRQHVQAYHRRRYGAVIRIQGLVRGFCSRQKLHRRRVAEMLVNGAVTFGSGLKGQPRDIKLWACLLALSRCISQRHAAVIQVQRWWRQRRKRSRTFRVLEKLAAQRRLLSRLQQSFYTVARSFFRQLRAERNAKKARQNAAAIKIQRRLRCWLMRRRYLSTLDRHSVAAQRGEKAAKKLVFQRVRRLFNGWREATRATKREQHEAACLVQRTFRRHRARRQARCVMAKKAAQARLLAAASQKPLERCFRQWEAAALLEKSVLHVRSSSLTKSRETTPVSGQRKPGTASGNKFDKPLTLEERAEIPSMLFYTLLNRVRRTGICQLSYSGGTVFKSPQLRQLISLSTSVIIDGGGGLAISSTSRHSLPNLNEQVVDALDACSSTTSSSCPVQSLILCNAPLRPSHSSILATILQRSRRSSSLALVSVVLANVPLAPASVVSLACALAQSPSCLQQLVLERCQVGSAGAAALFEALTYNRALWKLDLSGNHIADAACPALARALLAGSQLRVLALSRNFLSDRGVLGYLAPGLASSQLETLVLLQNPRVSSLGIAALREAAAVSIPSDPSGLRVVSD